MLAVTPSLEVQSAPPVSVVAAHLKADPKRPLQWRLEIDSGARGNHSRVVQGGAADGADREPLATVRVDSPGEAVLSVYDHGRLLARTERGFGAPPR